LPTIFGDYCGGVHLFPFRTEKLSPPAQMVLGSNLGEYVVAVFKTPIAYMVVGVFFL
jgi:hypothetical protein